MSVLIGFRDRGKNEKRRVTSHLAQRLPLIYLRSRPIWKFPKALEALPGILLVHAGPSRTHAGDGPAWTSKTHFCWSTLVLAGPRWSIPVSNRSLLFLESVYFLLQVQAQFVAREKYDTRACIAKNCIDITKSEDIDIAREVDWSWRRSRELE